MACSGTALPLPLNIGSTAQRETRLIGLEILLCWLIHIYIHALYIYYIAGPQLLCWTSLQSTANFHVLPERRNFYISKNRILDKYSEYVFQARWPDQVALPCVLWTSLHQLNKWKFTHRCREWVYLRGLFLVQRLLRCVPRSADVQCRLCYVRTPWGKTVLDDLIVACLPPPPT
jgi:hypothetical protein